MSLFSLFSGSHDAQEIVPIIRIGSGMVSGAVVAYAPGAKPVVVSMTRDDFPFSAEATPTRLLQAMKKSLATVAGVLARDERVKHNHAHVHIIYDSPWYDSRTAEINTERDEPVTISEDEIRRIVDQEAGKNGGLSGAMSMFERHVMQVRLNGYISSEPVGLTARTVAASFFEAGADTSILEEVVAIMHTELPKHELEHHSSSYVFFDAVRQLYPAQDSALLLHLGSELTDVTAMKRSVIRETVTFPFGANNCIRAVSAQLKNTPQQAHDQLALIRDGDAHQEAKDELEKALDEPKTAWLEYFKKAVVNMEERVGIVPSKVYISSENGLGGLVADFLGDTFDTTLVATKSFVPAPISQAILKEVVQSGQGVRVDTSTGLAALAAV